MVLLKRRQILDEYEDDSSQAKAAEKTKKTEKHKVQQEAPQLA